MHAFEQAFSVELDLQPNAAGCAWHSLAFTTKAKTTTKTV